MALRDLGGTADREDPAVAELGDAATENRRRSRHLVTGPGDRIE